MRPRHLPTTTLSRRHRRPGKPWPVHRTRWFWSWTSGPSPWASRLWSPDLPAPSRGAHRQSPAIPSGNPWRPRPRPESTPLPGGSPPPTATGDGNLSLHHQNGCWWAGAAQVQRTFSVDAVQCTVTAATVERTGSSERGQPGLAPKLVTAWRRPGTCWWRRRVSVALVAPKNGRAFALSFITIPVAGCRAAQQITSARLIRKIPYLELALLCHVDGADEICPPAHGGHC